MMRKLLLAWGVAGAVGALALSSAAQPVAEAPGGAKDPLAGTYHPPAPSQKSAKSLAAKKAEDAIDPILWAAPATVEVDMSNFAFTPSTIVLQRGTPYHLLIVNKSTSGHDFSAKDFFEAANIYPKDKVFIDAKGKISLKTGQSVQITLIPEQVGHFDLMCTHALHATMGMRGQLVVE
jgi:uncharacterized cupredoxin-like copper-binding protein